MIDTIQMIILFMIIKQYILFIIFHNYNNRINIIYNNIFRC